jgi:3'-phosphoadenosine 5'-phosphosulfate sulfotransferase (PAPS reductase)/FAD synthetase
MDWEQTPAQLDALAGRVGGRRFTVQAVYRRTGRQTRGGLDGVELSAIHDVDAQGPATAAHYPDGLRTLLDFALGARQGRPPTSQIRWCTHYFKIALFDAWVRRNRALLGPRPVLITGERWRESLDRERRLQPWEWRDSVALQTGNQRYPYGWRLLWLRPIIGWAWHQVNAYVHGCQIPFHPGYAAQGETLEAMLDPHRDERQGRARLSCRCCIFTHPRHLAATLRNVPELMTPVVEQVRAYEQTSGYSWQQRGRIDELLQPHRPEPAYRQQLLLPVGSEESSR